jgi:hypothetical protein
MRGRYFRHWLGRRYLTAAATRVAVLATIPSRNRGIHESVGTLSDEPRRDHDSNFLILRLLVALPVVFGHSYGISGATR